MGLGLGMWAWTAMFIVVELLCRAHSGEARPVFPKRHLLQRRERSQNDKNLGLLRASTEGDVSRVRGLLDAGAIVNTIDEYGWMSLHFAAGTNSANVVEVLVISGADINQKTGSFRRWRDRESSVGSTPLHLAAGYGSAETAQALLRNGADLNAVDADGDSHLHTAAFHGQSRVIQVLLSAGMSVNTLNSNGWTPLYLAARFGVVNSVEALLQSGADKSISDPFGGLPVDEICSGTACSQQARDTLVSLLK